MNDLSRRDFVGLSLILLTGQMCRSRSSGPISPLPLNSRLVLLGDSITHMGIHEDRKMLPPPAVSVSFTNGGYGNMTNILSGSRFFIPLHGNQGVNGDTVKGVLSRLSTVISLKPAVVLLLIGVNSIFHNTSVDSIKDDYRSICDNLIAAGAVVIAPSILPCYAGSYPALTPSQETIRQNINSFILSQTDIKSVDAESCMKSPSYFLDGLHLNSVGAYRLASKIAPILGSLIVPGRVLDLIDSSCNLITNPFLSGIKGTLIKASGAIADNWTLTAEDAGGATIKGIKSTNDDKQVIQISGTYAGNGKVAQLKNSEKTLLNTDDVIEGFLEFEILDSLNSICTVDVKITGFDAGKGQLVMSGESFYNSEHSNLQLPVGRYTMRTPPQKLTCPVVNLISSVNIVFTDAPSSAVVSGEFKIHNCSVRKVVEP